MMEELKRWIMGVVCTAFAISLASGLVPKGKEERLVRFVGSLILLLVMFSPFTVIMGQTISLPDLASEQSGTAQHYREVHRMQLQSIIEENTAAYIWDKARSMELECAVHVQAAQQQNGVILPWFVTVDHAYHPALSAWIEEETGIPPSRQNWQEGKP